MLGIFLIYSIGKLFYELAHEYHRSEWGFAIAGVVSYYFGSVLFSFMLGIIMAMGYLTFLSGTSDFIIGLIAMPFGALSCWGFYIILKRNWENAPTKKTGELVDVIDQDLIQ